MWSLFSRIAHKSPCVKVSLNTTKCAAIHSRAYLRLACAALKYERTVPGPREWSRAIMGIIDRGVLDSCFHIIVYICRFSSSLISHDNIACVASVSSRVMARKLEREQKKKAWKGDGEVTPPPSFLFFFFLLSPQVFLTSSRGNACYAGWSAPDAG